MAWRIERKDGVHRVTYNGVDISDHVTGYSLHVTAPDRFSLTLSIDPLDLDLDLSASDFEVGSWSP